ncbi:MAG TPA: GNAT family N-acetyltransferase [Burkholderiales bacterium]|nr:GNAT family N-acetyltransferase [Burkholderiales bacterium]
MLRHARNVARTTRAPLAPQIRAISPWDGFDLQQFIRDLSPESRYSRFMMGIRELPDYVLEHFVHPDPDKEAVLVATSPSYDLIGLAQYIADETGDGAEIALVVADAWQRKGLGRKLLSDLIDVAADNGVVRIHADVLADNFQMRGLARKLGFSVRVKSGAPFLAEISRNVAGRKSASPVVH